MPAARPTRVGNIPAAVRRIGTVDGGAIGPMDRLAHRRYLLAKLCRMLDPQPNPRPHPAARSNGDGPSLHGDMSPRMRQTLERLLAGDSEKEIAARFGRSRHTVHVYVKKLYQRFGVSSRGELFARFVRASAAGSRSG
jgi:DNA-binding CsgD family transcriptional regulator